VENVSTSALLISKRAVLLVHRVGWIRRSCALVSTASATFVNEEEEHRFDIDPVPYCAMMELNVCDRFRTLSTIQTINRRWWPTLTLHDMIQLVRANNQDMEVEPELSGSDS
jgi:hypothetical protein